MSTEATDEAVTTTSAAPIAQPLAAQQHTPSQQEPDWLPERIKRAKESAERELLAKLGVANADEVKAAIAAAKAAEEAKRTETEKVAARIAQLEAEAKVVPELQSAVSSYAEVEMAKLTPEQQGAVKTLAGENAAAQLRTIAALRSTWAQPAPAAAAAAPPAATPHARPAPASTSAASSLPSSAQTGVVDHRAEYERLKSVNGIAAAAYRQQYAAEIANATKV